MERRAAKRWSNQQTMTNLGVVHGNLSLDEQMKVRIALKMMRKAHIKGSKADRERDKIETTKSTSLETSSIDNILFVDKNPLKIKSIEEIIKKAKTSSNLTRDKLRLESETRKLGRLRPICKELVEDIKREEMSRIDITRPRKKQIVRSKSDLVSGKSSKISSNVMVGKINGISFGGPEYEETNYGDMNLIIPRPSTMLSNTLDENSSDFLDSEPSDSIIQYMSHEFSSHLFEHQQSNSNYVLASADDITLSDTHAREFPRGKSLPRPATAGARSATDPNDHRNAIMLLINAGRKRISTTDHPQYLNPIGNDLPDPDSIVRKDHALPLDQGVTSPFLPRVIESNEKIMRVIQVKETYLQNRTALLKKKIQEKERVTEGKRRMLRRMEQQRPWLILIALSARLGFLEDLVKVKRKQEEQWKTASATKRAIGFIERWWFRGRIRLLFKRYPATRAVLGRAFMRFNIRVKLRRKNNSATLLRTFLQDSTGLSESIRRIYVFRQKVIRIQIWIKSWFACQMARMRLLWMAGEVIMKGIIKSEKLLKRKQEKNSLKAISHLTGFSVTVGEISQVKRKIDKMLVDQSEAQKIREIEYHDIMSYRKLKHNQDFAEQINYPHPHFLGLDEPDHMPLETKEEKQVQNTRRTFSSRFQAPTPVNSKSQHRNSFKQSAPILQYSSGSPAPSPKKPKNTAPVAIPVSAIQRHKQDSGNVKFLERPQQGITRQSSLINKMPGIHSSTEFITNSPITRNHSGVPTMSASGNAHRKFVWHKKVKMSPTYSKTWDLLRNLLNVQRRRHILNTMDYRKRKAISATVNLAMLKKFLKDPNKTEDYEISNSIVEAQATTTSVENVSQPFLLLTQGGIEALEVLLESNKHLRF